MMNSIELTRLIRILILPISVLLPLHYTSGQAYNIDYSGTFDPQYDDPTFFYLADDELTSAMPIGFSFEFFGNTYTDFYLSSNGFITFDPAAGPGCCTAQSLPDPNGPNNLIAALWENLNTDEFSDYSYETIGTAPDRKLVVGFYAYTDCFDLAESQIILYEGSNVIEIHSYYYYACYQSTQGIENADGTVAYFDPDRNQDYYSLNDDFIAFIPAYDDDAGILFNPTSYCEGVQNIETIITNYGGNTINSLDVNWSWNGVVQTPVSITPFLPPGGNAVVTLGQQTLTFGDQDTLITWTSLPNGNSDANPANDAQGSYLMPGMHGTFTIGGSSPDYTTINDAVNALESTGVCDTVIMNIRPGTYNEQVEIGFIPGNYGDNYVIFQSETGDSSDVVIQYAATAFDENYVFRLRNVNNIILRNLTLEATGSSYGHVIEITLNANNNRISHCHLIGKEVTTINDDYAVIQSSGVFHDTKIEYSLIENGSYGYTHSQGVIIIFSQEETDAGNRQNPTEQSAGGGSSSNESSGLTIQHCHIKDFYRAGIDVSSCDNNRFIWNRIETTASNNYGIYLSENSDTFNISYNSIYLPNGYQGISVSYSTEFPPDLSRIHNNTISLGGTISNARGLFINNLGYTGIYFNSIHLTNTNSNSRAFDISNPEGVEVANNIFSNQGGGYAVYSGSSVPAFSNNNNFYSTGQYLARYGGQSLSTLEDWTEFTLLDSNSLQVDPLFNSDTDLHISQSLLNKVAIPVAGIDVDMDGDLRNPLFPDIGADEFIPLPDDLGATAFLSPTDSCQLNQNVTVLVKNFGSNQVSDYQVEWEVNGMAQTAVVVNSLIDTIGGSGYDTAHIVLGNLNFPEDSVIVLKAWTALPNGVADALTSNDTTGTVYQQPLMGDYVIGGGSPDFPSLQAASDVLAQFGICGPVNLLLADGIYSEQVSFPEIPGSSSINRITIRSQSADSANVTIQFNSDISENYFIELEDADHFTISDISFEATSSFDGRIIVFEEDVKDIRIDKCAFRGSQFDLSGAEIIRLNGASADSISITNCSFLLGSHAISLHGSGSEPDDRARAILIENNNFTNQLVSGIDLTNSSDAQIHNNNLQKLSTDQSYSALYFNNVDGGLEVSHNFILVLQTGRGIWGNQINLNDRSEYAVFYNNYIRVSEGNWDGASFNNSYNTKFSYNTITNQSEGTTSAALRTTSVDTFEVLNNILSSASGYAFYFFNSGSPDILSDHNDLFSANGNTGYFGGIRATLADWQTATSWDAQSVSADPQFIHPEDYHVLSIALNGAGTPIPGITIDFDGEARDAVNPDIGADEIATSADDAGVAEILPESPFYQGLQDVRAVIRNYGNNQLTSLNVEWELNSIAQPVFNYSGSLGPLEVDTLILGSVDFEFGISYTISAWTDIPNGTTDTNTANDTLVVSELYPAVSGTLTVGGSDPDFNTIQDAVSAMQNGGILDSAIFRLRNGSFNELILLEDNSALTCDQLVVFESESGDPEDVIWTNNGLSGTPLILSGADGLIFRNITFEATHSSYAHAVELINEAHCNTFEGCRFLGVDGTSTNANQAVFYSPGSLDTGNHFINNYFRHGSYGLYFQGAGDETGTLVHNNAFENQYSTALYLRAQNGPVVSNNVISNTETIHSGYVGISLYQCDNRLKILANHIVIDLGDGIFLNTCSSTSSQRGLIANNFIQVGGSAFALGIALSSTQYQNVFHNTSRMLSTASNAYPYYMNYSSNVDVKNNIFFNEGPGPVINFQNASVFGTSDHNCLYTNGSLFVNTNGTDYFSLSEWQGAGFDANSLNVDPEFVELSQPEVTSALLNDAGIPLPDVTTDIYGDPRDTENPDMGAVEFLPFTDDVGIVAINYPTQPFPSGVNTVFIKFINNGVDTLTSMQVDWEVNGMPQPTYIWSGLLPSAGTYDSLDIGNFDFAPFEGHEIKVWVSEPNGMEDGLASNDTLQSTDLYPGLLGNYTIGGVEPDFDSLSQAVAALHLGGAAGPVNFLIRPGTYIETMNIKEFPGCGCTTPVIFTSESGDSSSVIISNLGIDDNIVTLDSADGIIFKHLTMTSVNPSFRRVIEYFNGAHCNKFLNNHLIGYEGTSTSSNYSVIWSNTSLDTANIFRNNLIEYGSDGMYIRGSNGTPSGTVIENNHFRNYYYYGIYAYREDALRIHNNIFQPETYTASGGLDINECDGNVVITQNDFDITHGRYGIYVANGLGSTSERGLIANNFVSVGGTSTAYGIYLTNADYCDVYFNNVNVYSSTSSSTNNSGFYLANSDQLQLYNNIAFNQSPGYAINANNNNGLISDHNDFAFTGTNFGSWNGGLQADLTAWQGASANDNNSISSNPQYMSDIDLHVTNVLLNGTGITTSLSTDYDGETRNDPPDIGADEFVPAANNDGGIFALNGPVVPFAAGTQGVEVTLKNFGGNPLTDASIRWIVNGIEQAPYSWTGNISSGGCDTVIIGNYPFSEYSPHELIIWAEMPNGVPDSTNVNDTLIVQELYPALSGAYTVGGVLPDFNLFSQLQESLNKGGILSDVTFNIRNGNYSSQLDILDFPRLGPSHAVLFQSESGDSSKVTIVRDFSSGNNYTIRLSGAPHIHFHQMTLRSTQGRVLEIANGASNITVSNCRLQGVQYPANVNFHQLIYSNTTTEDSINIIDNRFEYGGKGIYLTASSGDREDGLVISGNTFIESDDRALDIRDQTGALIDGNIISMNGERGNAGMFLSQLYETQAIRNNEVRITNGTFYGMYLSYVQGTSGAPAMITNNYILLTGGTSAVTGLRQDYGNYNQFFHNTVRVENSHADSEAFYDNNSNHNIDLYNCIFANYGGGRSIYTNWANGFHSNEMDNCNLYSSGPVLAYWFNNYSDLASLQTATGINLNSTDAEPLFSDASYKVFQAALDGTGSAIPGTVDDIEGEARNLSTPDIGCDEFTLQPDDIGAKYLLTPGTYCGLGAAEQVAIEIQNFGSSPQTGFNVAYSLDGSAWHVENVGALTVQPGGVEVHTFSTTEDLSQPGTYEFAIRTQLAGDQNTGNDTIWDIQIVHIPALTTPVSNMIPEDETIGLEKNVSLSWAPAPNASRYDIYLWKEGTPQPGTPQVDNITQINTLYQNLEYGQRYNWQVIAENVCDQMAASDIQQFTIRELPDLRVDTVIAPPTAFSGQEIEVEWQVYNNGPGNTQFTIWSDAIYLSTDATLNTSFDTYLGAVQNLTALDSGIAYTNTGMVSIPNGYSGNYYVFVHSDRWNSLTESNNNNNWNRTSSPMMINLTPPPDLKVESIAAPVTSFSGQPISVQYTVKNIGLDDTQVNEWYDRVVFTSDPLNYAGGTVIGTFKHTGELEMDSSYTRNVTVNVPPGIFGNRYVYVITDWFNVVFENAGENNNVGRSDTIEVILTPPPDLQASDLSFPDTVHNNEEILLTYTLENKGGSTININYWYDQFYYSPSPVYNTNFLQSIGTQYTYGPLAPFEPVIKGHLYTMSKTAGGEYFYYIHLDRSDVVFEHTYETNNIVRSPATFIVVNPDLRPDSITYQEEAVAGENVTIDWLVINDGPGKLIERNIQTRIYLSDAQAFNIETATQLVSFNVSNIDLGIGDTLAMTYAVTIPDGTEGTQYLHVFTDANEQIFENGLEANNVNHGEAINITLPPYPDIISRELFTVDSVNAGELFSLSYEKANIGTDSIAGTSTDSIFLSFSPVWNPASNISLGQFGGVNPLAEGDSQLVELNLLIPPTQQSNFYYLYVKSDAKNDIFELTGEANNISRSDTFFVSPPEPVDLVVDTVYPSMDTVSSGNNVNIHWTTRNLGPGTADAIGWFEAGYLSTDTILDRDLDFRFFEHEIVQDPLEPDSLFHLQKSAQIPNGFSGDYYLFVYSDDYSGNYEIDSLNNFNVYRNEGQPKKIHIELSPSPDLFIQGFSAPVSAIAGQPLSVNLTIKNSGNAQAPFWQTKLYLSTDQTINSGDILLATDIVTDTPLLPGNTHQTQLSVFLPVNAIGNYILIAQVDAVNQLYEHNGESNNIQTRTLEVVLPPPSDLSISAITIPDSAFAGDIASVTWKTRNTGANPASGVFREIVYFSLDTTLDVSDQVFGILDSTVYVPPGGQVNRSFNARLNGLSRDNFYALVQTDARNNIYESNDTNNLGVSDAQMYIDIEQLHLDSLTEDVFTNGQQHYFRIEIPGSFAGENLRITVDGDSLAAYNEIYLKYGEVPTPADFEANNLYALNPDQELIFENLQGGTYFIMCRGFNPQASDQEVSILARIIDFELLSVSPGRIARNTQATLELIGSQMDTLRNAYIVRDSTIRIKADTIYMVNSRRAYATFTIDSIPFYGLGEVPLGFYDVQAERWDGKLAEKIGAVEIIDQGEAADLQFVMEYPTSVGRRNQPMKITIYMQNSGDADLVGENFIFEAPYGNQLAFTLEDLLNGNSNTTLSIPVEGAFGPPGILPPKGSRVFEVFAYSRPHPTFALTPVND